MDASFRPCCPPQSVLYPAFGSDTLVGTTTVFFSDASPASRAAAASFANLANSGAFDQYFKSAWDGYIGDTYVGLPTSYSAASVSLVDSVQVASLLAFTPRDAPPPPPAKFKVVEVPRVPSPPPPPPSPPVPVAIIEQVPATLVLTPYAGTKFSVRDQVVCVNATDTSGESCTYWDRARDFSSLSPSDTIWSAAPNQRFSVALTSDKRLSGVSREMLLVESGAVLSLQELVPGRVFVWEIQPAGTGTFKISVAGGAATDAQTPSLLVPASNVLSYQYSDAPISPTIQTAGGRVIYDESPINFVVNIGTRLLEGPGRAPEMIVIEGANSSSSVYGKSWKIKLPIVHANHLFLSISTVGTKLALH